MKNKNVYALIVLTLLCLNKVSFSQVIYQHNFGTATITAVNPYVVAPTTIDGNLSASQWSTSAVAGFTTFAGSAGQALSLTNSGGTPTYSLSYTVGANFNCDITAFSFWSKRSTTGAPNWTLSVNGSTTIGTGTTTTLTAGASTGTVPVANPTNSLSGTVNVVLKLAGGTGGSFRLDDFTLYGTVYSTVTCTPPTVQASSYSSTGINTNSATVSWTSGNGNNVIVVAHQAIPVNASPANGNAYTANSVFASGQQIGTGNFVVFNGVGNSVNVTGLTTGTDYYFSVYEYNSPSNCYLSPALTGSLITSVCLPPSVQASLFTSSSITNNSATVSWTSGNGGNAIVLAHQTATVNAVPVNGTAYTANSVFASGQQIGVGNYVVYNGAGNTVNVTGLNPGTDYHFSVFEYNTLTDCYLSPALTGSIITTNTTVVGANCLKIKSILVEACGAPESSNEMVYFQNGSNPLPINQISIAGAPTSGVYALNKWPNPANAWNGLVQNATTANNVAIINGTITACGHVLEPPQTAGIGVIPPFANVILVGSQGMSPLVNSFSNLTDTVYMIFQTFATTTGGHFVNYTAGPGTRGFVIIDNLHACTSNSVTYQPGQLSHLGNGDAVSFDNNNNITYFNSGCQAPYIPFSVGVSPNQTICYNSQAVVTATPSGVYSTVSWSGGTGVFSSPSSLTTSYTPGASETGTVQLLCTITRTCAANSFSASAAVALSITSLPLFSLAATNGYSLCPSASSVLSYSVTNAANAGVITPSWTSPAGSGTTYTVPAPTGAIPVTYTLDLTNTCGATQKTFTVYPLALPTVSLSAKTPTACVGSTLTLTAIGNTGNYSWNNPVSSSASVTITAGSTTSGIVTSTNSCGTVNDTYTLTVTQNPVLSVDNTNVNLCAGQSATVTATSSSGTYSWTPDAVNTNSIVVNAAGTHTVTTSNVCSSKSATVNVAVSAAATLSISSTSNAVCSGGQVTSTLSLNGSTGTYTWSNGANTPTIAISAPGVYNATVNAGFCGLANASFTVGTIVTPTISVASTSTLLCNGVSATLTASSNLNNYSWTGGSVNTNSIIVNATGLYTVGVSNACGSPSASINILADATPTLNLVSNTPTLCPSQSATLTVSGGIDGSYTWSNSASTSSVVIATAGNVSVTYFNVCGSDTKSFSITTIPNPTVTIATNSINACPGDLVNVIAASSEGNYAWTGSANTTATLTLSASSTISGTVTTTNVCNVNATATYTINVSPTPILTVDATSIGLCTGQSTVVTASSSTGTYTWMPGGINTNTLTINSTGNYTVYTSNVCERDSMVVNVTVSNSPTLTISSSTGSLCASGQTAILTAGGSSGSCDWSDGTIGSQSITVNGPGIYTATVTTASCGSATASFTVDAIPTPTISVTATSTLLCNGATATLTANTNMTNEAWSNGAFNTNTISINTAGIYTVGVFNSCGNPTATINIQTGVTPALNLTTSASTLCPNETATLTVTGGVQPYVWSNSTSTGSVVTTTGGMVSVTYSNVCGTDTKTLVVATSSVNAGIQANPGSGVKPLVVTFNNVSVGATSYVWNFGNGNSAVTSTVIAQTYTNTGSFYASIIATDGTCFDKDSVLITVLNEAPTLVIPNVFTPNNDSINDVFKVTGINIADFNCSIFDRWGLQMYSWSDIKGGWDGTAGGKSVPAGTYFYMINAKDIDGKEIKKQGYLQLFK
jgi:gliding motility-associated-like protein